MENAVKIISEHSVLGLGQFWSIIVWIGEASLYLAFVVISLIAIWSIVYFALRKFHPEFADKQKELTIRILRDNFYGSEVYEAAENLAESVYGAIASLLNTLALIISLAFTSFTVIIAYPFRYLQNALDGINSRLIDMREEQQNKIAQKRQRRHKNRDNCKDPVPHSLNEEYEGKQTSDEGAESDAAKEKIS